MSAPASLSDPVFPPLRINPELVRRSLVGFIRNEVRKVGFERVVLGLSGGVDSSLVAALAAEALGAENVLAVIMPYKTSDPKSKSDALQVVQQLGIHHLEIDISPQIDAYFGRFPDADQKRRGNKMARERMSILYDQSWDWRALVIGTSNKTELLLGYGTIYGDMASAINPVGDLYKTQLWQLADAVGVPTSIVQKAPSADLWAGQSDETELGFQYRMIDQLLYYLVERRSTVDELKRLGFDEAFIVDIIRRVHDIPLVSDAGTPALSDPGVRLVGAAVAAGYPVVPIPGPSAVLAALVSSGLPTNQFTFLGFLPRKRGELERLIRETAQAKRSFVFFESPHRIVKTLDIMASALGPRSLVVAREITKLHEEFLRGTPATLLEHFAKSPPRGELTVVVAGSDWKAK